MWFECSPGSIINSDGTLSQPSPPTQEALAVWMEKFKSSATLRHDVWRRFVVTRRGRQKFENWLKSSFFFTNATPEQLQIVYATLLENE